ncbi:hypothetical protein MMRN_p1140 (plasmid) [Mycobacterium marinum]|nr:hypothetical protein [Mycobacterium marinum]BBC69145.1 hypothetical protein MMRN_p1140 [Mycobacterium marinum]GJO46672.1 hypothetical protein NJB1604_27050 [Mycobacterium marinum]CDM79536.1 hypothetical protein MMARE11_p00330 [Mycobacterium marinum E11]
MLIHHPLWAELAECKTVVDLTLHGSDVNSVFDLLGHNENDLTAALGFALAKCPPLLDAVLTRIASHLDWRLGGDASIAMEVRDNNRRTDLEIRLADGLVIFEAKRGWLLPTTQQLRRYAGRVRHHGNGVLVTLSQASHALAAKLPSDVLGVPVLHLPWNEVLIDTTKARQVCRGRERLWLEELRRYLTGVIRVRSVADSWTYCVALNRHKTGGKKDLTFIEWVTEALTYYHPYGVSGWPTDPPNFMAFRWDGAVRRIHRVEKADVYPTLLDCYPDLPQDEKTMRPHAVYKLGKRRLPPLEPIKNGASYRAIRLWVLLDQLQTATTLAEAHKRTRELNQSD